MNRLLLFNCSNDLALASNAKEYIATKSIAAMETDLAVPHKQRRPGCFFVKRDLM